MVTVTVGGSQKSLEEALKGGWISEQFERQGTDRGSICVQVAIKRPNIDLLLSTPSCGGGGGGNRSLTAEENRVVELWRRRGLTDLSTNPGEVQAFLRQLSQLL